MTDSKPKPTLKSSPVRPKQVSQPNKNFTKKNIGSGGNKKPPISKTKKVGENNNPMPNPWLLEEEPPIDNTAGFTEYLRWMRELTDNKDINNGTKIQILQKIQDNSQNYNSRLATLNQRTKLMADVSCEAQSMWRIRVGGHRGVENILLPAFDALGMPYIPSSSLRGVARNYAIREIMKNKGLEWKDAEKQIAPYFGSIDTNNKANQAGKVVFFDAYPTQGCLEMDMANNIWSWEGDNLNYSPNPNPFLSLKDATFVIGLRLASNCQDKSILEIVKNWLIKGLSEGIGSQINSGYGQLKASVNNINVEGLNTEFLRVELGWEGQLIHGSQAFTRWTQNNRGDWQMRGKPIAEVRSTAFKSMLRYWFRAFALGVLPAKDVQEWEGKLFGSISPNQYHGYIQCNVLEGKLVEPEARTRDDYPGEQSGILTLTYSSETAVNQQETIKKLMKNLTWMMLNLGGIGQGARRPQHKRNNNPWRRGSTFFIDSKDTFWKTGDTAREFHGKFREKLTTFYSALNKLSNKQINHQRPRNNGQVTRTDWQEAIDINCRIIVCSGNEKFNKPYALATLHSEPLKRNRDYDGDLCGKVRGGAKASPVWLTDGGDYQVVTVFGATQNPRLKFLQTLKDNATQYHQIFPFN